MPQQRNEVLSNALAKSSASCIRILDRGCVRTKHAPSVGRSAIVSINENALLSSALTGLDVHNEGRELLGKIEDVVFEGGQLVGIVLKVGKSKLIDQGCEYLSLLQFSFWKRKARP